MITNQVPLKNGGRIIPAGKTICPRSSEIHIIGRQETDYLVSWRVEVRVNHRRIHLPLLSVSGLPKLQPGLDLVIGTKGNQDIFRKQMDNTTIRKTYEALNMFSKNLSPSIFTDE